MDLSSVFGSSAKGKWLLAVAIAIGLALSVGVLAASSVAAKSKTKHHKTHHAKVQKSTTTAVPKSCPSVSVVATNLDESVSGVTATGAGSMVMTCSYAITSEASYLDTTIHYYGGYTAAAFASARSAENAGIGVTNVPGLGNQAWVANGGSALSVRKGSLCIVVGAPGAPAAALEALAAKIL
jgi:hypothetical protein